MASMGTGLQGCFNCTLLIAGEGPRDLVDDARLRTTVRFPRQHCLVLVAVRIALVTESLRGTAGT